MRVLLLFALSVGGCTAEHPDPVPNNHSAAETAVQRHELVLPACPLPNSPFLPAVVRAGLFGVHAEVSLVAIEFIGHVQVSERSYAVLYVEREIEISTGNRRDASYWLVCDDLLRPVWKQRAWGGKPKECIGDSVLVELSDKFFEVDDDGSYGDMVAFSADGDCLRARCSWSSEAARIEHALNWEKHVIDSNEPSESVEQVLAVPAYPSWRLILTQYDSLWHQGCAKLVEVGEHVHNEFGVRKLAGGFGDQCCKPSGAGFIRMGLSRDVLVWIDYKVRGQGKYRVIALLSNGVWIELVNLPR